MELHKSRILITGGCGFIGSNMVLHMLRTYPEATIVNLDRLDYCASTSYFEDMPESMRQNYHFVKGDICTADLVSYLLESFQIDVVLHFAAQTHVDLSFANSLDFTRTNAMGTHILLECVRKYGRIIRFVHVSTDEVYGESAYNDMTTETALLQPTNPYAASKMAAEAMVQSYWKSFKIPLIIVRCNNVYGPHQFPEKLIPKFTMLLRENRPLSIHGNGMTRRSFIYVDDVVRAYDLILQAGALGEIYNIEAQDELTVVDVTRHMLKRNLVCMFEAAVTTSPEDAYETMDASVIDAEFEKRVDYVRDRNFNDLRYAIDGGKLKSLGFEQRVRFPEGIAKTMQWYFEHDMTAVWSADVLEKALKPHSE